MRQVLVMQGSPVSCNLNTAVDSQDKTSYMRKQCAEGHYGPLCSQCIRDGPEPYGRTSTWACQKCKSNSQIIITFAASNLLVLAFLYYSIHTTLVDNEEDIANPGQSVKASELTRVSLLHSVASEMILPKRGIYITPVSYLLV